MPGHVTTFTFLVMIPFWPFGKLYTCGFGTAFMIEIGCLGKVRCYVSDT
jgi:hypothetical protein